MAHNQHDQWMKRLDQIEKRLDDRFEQLASHPLFLGAVAVVMNADSHRKILVKESMNRIWKSLQLPNRRDQERELHLLHEIQHRLLELEDRVRKLERTEKSANKAKDFPTGKRPRKAAGGSAKADLAGAASTNSEHSGHAESRKPLTVPIGGTMT